MRKSILCTMTATLAVALGLGMAHADGLPGMRGQDHTGITVPDMNEALTFFVDVLGCKKAMSFGPIADPEPNGTFMKDALGVDPKTVIKQITLVRCGMGSNIELFSYQSPDQKVVQPKNSDIGGYHIAFYVDDIKAAADYLHAKGVKTMMEPIPITEGPAAGQAIVYFNAPWGLQLEAISYPKGMAYEKDASTILWTPKDPSKWGWWPLSGTEYDERGRDRALLTPRARARRRPGSRSGRRTRHRCAPGPAQRRVPPPVR
jgi:catechol 2,3-dioxygenase-like lactoylglutathione lyase family enzyme